MRDEITHPFINFNGETLEVYEWISNFIPHFTRVCNYLSVLALKLNHASKRGYWAIVASEPMKHFAFHICFERWSISIFILMTEFNHWISERTQVYTSRFNTTRFNIYSLYKWHIGFNAYNTELPFNIDITKLSVNVILKQNISITSQMNITHVQRLSQYRLCVRLKQRLRGYSRDTRTVRHVCACTLHY